MAKVTITVTTTVDGVGIGLDEIEKCDCGNPDCVSPARQVAGYMINFAKQFLAVTGATGTMKIIDKVPGKTPEQQIAEQARLTRHPGSC